MFDTRRAALVVLIPLVLAGCAAPQNRFLKPEVASAIQPLDVQIGVKQAELYADFERSNIAAGAAACGAVPGLGILLAAACGATMGAMDASVNAERAKVAEGLVRPLKDAVVDVKVDQMLNESFATSLRGVPKMQFSGVKVTKTVDDKAYEGTFRASTSSAVMFVNVDYKMSSDFSTVEVSAVGLIFPRTPSARTAAGMSAQLPDEGKASPLRLTDAAYRADVIYRGALPTPGTASAQNIEAWKADNARLLRSALQDGGKQVARLLAEDMQRGPGKELASLGKADAGKGLMGDVVWAGTGGAQLIRVPSGAFVYKTVVVPPATQTGAVASPVVQ